MKSRGLKKADFFVLRGVLMPAALVEIGYITNRKEAALLVRPSYQAEMAEGIVRGISIFIDRYNRDVRK
jgi:N-acetylmuramoyl-L-alanine amidase